MGDTTPQSVDVWIEFANKLLDLQSELDTSGVIYQELEKRIIYAINQAQICTEKYAEAVSE